MSASLAAGVGTGASHLAAAALWLFPGFDPGALEITGATQIHSGNGLIVHHAQLPRVDLTRIDGIPVTSPTRTIIDIAGVLPDKTEVALDDGLRRNLTSLALLRRRMEALGRKPGTALLRKLIDERDGMPAIPQTVFETHLFRFIMDSGFPQPVCQHPVHKDGRLFAVLDFAYPDLMIGIEADGYVGHSGPRQWKHDHRRREGLASLGWHMIHVIWEELESRPDTVAQRIAEAIAQSHRF